MRKNANLIYPKTHQQIGTSASKKEVFTTYNITKMYLLGVHMQLMVYLGHYQPAYFMPCYVLNRFLRKLLAP